MFLTHLGLLFIYICQIEKKPDLMSFFKQSILLLSLLLVSCAFYAQNAAVKGFLYDKETGEPLIGVNIYTLNGQYSTTSNIDGYYSLTKMADGDYQVVFSMVGFLEVIESVSVAGRDVKMINKKLAEDSINLKGADVFGELNDQKNEVRIGIETVTPKEISRLPSIGGAPDIAQYLQVIPGVTFTGDQGGQLYIRGGSPIQNKVLLDGMVVYNPFHSIGLFSVFETDIIRTADVYTGGFNANFGGRVSSVMDVKTIDGNKNKHKGRIAINPFGAKAVLQGPIKKSSENGGAITYLLTAKRSYLQESSKVLYDYIDEEGLPFNFLDLYGKLTFSGSSGSKFSAYGFSFNDDVRYKAISDFNWQNNGAGANFVVSPQTSTVLINGFFSFSDYSIELREDELDAQRSSSIGGSNFGLDFKYILGDDNINYGVQIQTLQTEFNTFNDQGIGIGQTENTTEAGLYVKYKKQWDKIIIEPGLRFQYYSAVSGGRLEPRLGVKVKPSEVFRIKAAAGLYSQNIISGNSDRDVVNLFYGFLTAPDEIQDEFVNKDGDLVEVKNALQKASHLMLGFEFDITEKLNLNIEGYVKNFNQLTSINRNKIFEDTPENQDQPDYLRQDFLIETGLARGADLVLKYSEKSTYLYFVYSLGKVTRWDGIQEYSTIFDRRHNINFVATQTLGKKKTWEASLRWNYGSGFPFTQTRGYIEEPSTDGGVAGDYYTLNGDYGILYSDLNGGRLSDYHRLDIGIKKTIDLENLKIEITGGATNVYSRDNVFYLNRLTNERVDQLPFLPSVGFDLLF
tara:strand:- start:13305 stop:15689 length:2385 start_codon:yes stop_codon:yes gene_type:complete